MVAVEVMKGRRGYFPTPTTTSDSEAVGISRGSYETDEVAVILMAVISVGTPIRT